MERLVRGLLLFLLALGACGVCVSMRKGGGKSYPGVTYSASAPEPAAEPEPPKKKPKPKAAAPRPAPDAEAPPAGDPARFEECRAKMKAAQSLGVLHDLKWTSGGATPKAFVGPTFFQMPIDGKQGFADTLNCFLMGGAEGYIDIKFLDWRTGNEVGRYSWGKVKMD